MLGIVSVSKKDKALVSIFLGPVLLVLFGSYLNKYPFGQRFVLFAMPAFLLFLCEGLVFVVHRSGKFRAPVYIVY